MTNVSELKLKPLQVAALVVLMAEARPLSNSELKELAGFDLTGAERTGLVEHRFITSTKVGRSFVHEISEEGWGRIDQLLRVEAIGGIGPARGALKVLLNSLERAFKRHSKKAGDFFYGSVGGQKIDLEEAIRLAYKDLVKQPGEWVRLPQIRAAVALASRADVDAALAKLAVQPDVRIIPVANLKSLTPEDREAAIELGGELNHAIAIEG